ncbi:MAG: alpha/beta fold hydrolase [Gemmatimonadaceae bacterium]
MANSVQPRRNAPDTWYPAGVAGVRARWLTLEDGERIRLVEPEDTGAALPVALLLHGWGCNAFHFRRLLPVLAEHGVRGIAMDLRGHGLSHKPAEATAYTSAALSTFVERAMDALSIERVGVVGHSLGGAVALDLALAAPQRVGWLTLLNPAGLSRLPYAPLFHRVPVRHVERLPAAVSRAVGFVALNLAYGDLARPDAGDLEQYLFPTLLPGGRFGMLAYAKAFSWEPRSAAAIARIECPTHVLLGERDRVIRSQEAIELLRAITHARVEVVRRAGHVLAEEAPQKVADSIAVLAQGEAERSMG